MTMMSQEYFMMSTWQNKMIKRFDLILDNWKALAIDQMQKTNPIAFAKSVYEFEELNENEIKELLYEMYNVYIAKLNND